MTNYSLRPDQLLFFNESLAGEPHLALRSSSPDVVVESFDRANYRPSRRGRIFSTDLVLRKPRTLEASALDIDTRRIPEPRRSRLDWLRRWNPFDPLCSADYVGSLVVAPHQVLSREACINFKLPLSSWELHKHPDPADGSLHTLSSTIMSLSIVDLPVDILLELVKQF
ncbi:hypothetical protein B0H19DRAFT_1250546 [Mycena capillaripes]|nr:hypothetical protein B0H19DRAFT_1250546 [Mycena capillaripes]